MKANGLNYKIFRYETHDYMDMYPEVSFRTYKTKEEMDAFVAHMRKHWCSGTVSDGVEMTPEAFAKERASQYWKGYENQLDRCALDCTQEWIDEYEKLINK